MSLLNTNIGPERVQVFSQPLGVVQTPGASTSVTAFLISTTFSGAPVNSPVRVTSLEEFEAQFGGPDDVANDAYYAIQGYYDNGGTGKTAIIVHVGTSPTAASYIGSSSAGSGLRALDLIDDLNLVCVPGLPLSQAYLVHPALIDYSKTVRTEFGASLSTVFSLLSIPRQITKANADVAVAGPYTISSISGNVLQFPASTNLSAVTPGMIVKLAGVYKATISAVNDSLDQVTVVALNGLVATNSVTLELPSAVNYKEKVVNDPSKVDGWYFNPAVVLDRGATPPSPTKAVDPVGHIAGVMGRMDSNIAIGGVSHAPAGIQFAGLAGIQGLALALSERLDAEPLRLNFINRLQSFPGAGSCIFGAYTGDSGTSPASTPSEQLIQVMRTVQYIKGSLETGLRAYIWENFSPDTQAKVERSIEAFLQNNIHLFPAGLTQDQQFKVISVQATQNDIDGGLLKVRIQIKPNTAVRFIEIALEFPLPTA